MKTLLRFVAVLAGVLCCARTQATPITVNNPSMELPVLAAGGRKPLRKHASPRRKQKPQWQLQT